jgi:hypothetical protein
MQAQKPLAEAYKQNVVEAAFKGEIGQTIILVRLSS